MSRTKELLNHILEIISEITEIDKSVILSRNKSSEVVDSRYILIEILHKSGIYPSKIASEIGFSVRNVQFIISHFDDRMAYNKPMRNNYELIKRWIGNN